MNLSFDKTFWSLSLLHNRGGSARGNPKSENDSNSDKKAEINQPHNTFLPEHLYEQTGKQFFDSAKLGAEILVKAEQAFEHAIEDEVHTFFPDQ